MLFVRGDGVILVGHRLLLLHAGVNRDFPGLATVKNIAGYCCTSKLTAAPIIVHDRRACLLNQIIRPQDTSVNLSQGIIGLWGLGRRRPRSIANPTGIQYFYLKNSIV